MGFRCEATEDLHASTPKGVGGFAGITKYAWVGSARGGIGSLAEILMYNVFCSPCPDGHFRVSRTGERPRCCITCGGSRHLIGCVLCRQRSAGARGESS